MGLTFPRACARVTENTSGACTYLHLFCNDLQVNMLRKARQVLAPTCTWFVTTCKSISCKKYKNGTNQYICFSGASRCKHLSDFKRVRARIMRARARMRALRNVYM